MVKSCEITAGTLISYFTYTSLLFSPISRLINLVPQLKQMSISLDRINFMLKRKKINKIRKNLNIIYGLYRNYKGNILYSDSITKLVAYVPQCNYLFNETIKNNLIKSLDYYDSLISILNFLRDNYDKTLIIVSHQTNLIINHLDPEIIDIKGIANS
ncbi:hypothetical protein KYB31_17015 [Clostridium felsineum]|uniref:hypothetical protein n=1 Tax=Clostridium felsineum TaxID=36839 RepID=UPI00214D5331|nr:hypothetical protein [Clostridium felsineum]MCR3760682.1 hypothetical protein [Clostridium felsineum]